jgi:TetR/AcrR family transcriptional regulator of autoinduction and epiphytic fitness
MTAITEIETLDKQHPRSKREQIVRAAVKIFLENGYKATSMNRVADEAGVIKATIYSHFKDKEQLFAAIIEELTIKKTRLRYTDESILECSPEQFIERMGNMFKILMDDPEYHALCRVMAGESGRFPELAELYVKTVIMPGMDMASAYFTHHPELKIADPQALAHICAGSFVSLIFWQNVLGGKKLRTLEFERVKNTLKQLVVGHLK